MNNSAEFVESNVVKTYLRPIKELWNKSDLNIGALGD